MAKYSLLRAGMWRGVLQLNDSTELPFTFEIDYKTRASSLTVINASERIVVEAFRQNDDSVHWAMPVFNTQFRCRKESDTTFSGEWYNTAASKPYTLKFRAEYKQPRIPGNFICTGVSNFTGKYECTFSPGLKGESKAIGLFNLEKNGTYTGTFATEYGDYRFLEGGYTGCSEMALSIFDGQFAMLFTARMIFLA